MSEKGLTVLVTGVVELGLASFHVKPLLMGGAVWGGLVFGFGMAVLGYCPGTMAISAGQGSLDALVGLVGSGMLFHCPIPGG